MPQDLILNRLPLMILVKHAAGKRRHADEAFLKIQGAPAADRPGGRGMTMAKRWALCTFVAEHRFAA